MSFYRKILDAGYDNQMFYGKYVAESDSEHDKDRIYYLHRNNDARDGFADTIYSGDNRGMGQGGYDSNLIAAGDKYFIEATEAEYEAQKVADEAIPKRDLIWDAKDSSVMGKDARLGKFVMQLMHVEKIRANWTPHEELPKGFSSKFGIRVNEEDIDILTEVFQKQLERVVSGDLKFYGRY